MGRGWMRYELAVRKGAVLDQEVDALLIPTTRDLVVGGSFGTALLRAAGPELQAACRRIAPIGLGDAAVTTAGDLKALIVIHAACISLGQTTKSLIERAYTCGFELAERGGIQTVATPALNIPAAGMSLDETTRMLVKLVKGCLDGGTVVQRLVFTVASVEVFRAYSAACRGGSPEEVPPPDDVQTFRI